MIKYQMSRTLKFRAWNGWSMEYGGFSIHATGAMDEICMMSGVNKASPVMQFTGLKDIKGNDIYEGDIVYLAGYGNYECEFPFLDLYEAMAERDVGAIIGNIHQNPDMIE